MGLLFDTRKTKKPWDYKTDFERDFAKGFERGFVIGLERGEKRVKAESAGWYARMKQAEKEGRDFNEPPPFLDDNDADQK